MGRLGRRAALKFLAAALAMGIAPAHAQGPRGPGPFGGGPPPGGQRPGGGPQIPPGAAHGERILDVHAHFIGRGTPDFVSGAEAAVQAMDQLGIAKTITMPPPQPPNFQNQYDFEALLPALRRHGDRFAFLGGGGTLNPLIQDYGAKTAAPASVQRDFTAAAERVLTAGAAGFGEITAEHVSYEPNHPYESAAPDSPLMLLLAELAGKHDVPIDFHMDAAVEDRPSPASLAGRSPNNPKTIPANVARFERLLAHNRAARIVWAHAGRDTIGDWTVALSRELLRRHSNLFMSISLTPPIFAVAANHPLAQGMAVKPEWIQLIDEFPDRFMIGSDHFYAGPHLAGRRPGATPAVRWLVNGLPPMLARKVARENAERVYKIRV